MTKAAHKTKILLLLLFISIFSLPAGHAASQAFDRTSLQDQCFSGGWSPISIKAAGHHRAILWKAPPTQWRNGTIVIMHGGGGSHHHFCAGGKLVQPQVSFARMAISQGFAVFLLDSTNDVVTDSAGRKCGKRFDFSVLDRPNLDLPFIEKVLSEVIPLHRPEHSSKKIFLTGLSTGGYMTIRAATHFDDKITAFAPVSAGDPYSTETNCDVRLSRRKSAKGVLLDIDTGKQIIEKGACLSLRSISKQTWESASPARKPAFMQFHNRGDGIVDLSCMRKAQRQLQIHGYINAGEFLLRDRRRAALNHLWLLRYNQPILDFFKNQ